MQLLPLCHFKTLLRHYADPIIIRDIRLYNLREPLNNLRFKLYSEAVLMVLPSQLSWREARDQCRRFGGGLHLDTSAEEVRPRSL